MNRTSVTVIASAALLAAGCGGTSGGGGQERSQAEPKLATPYEVTHVSDVNDLEVTGPNGSADVHVVGISGPMKKCYEDGTTRAAKRALEGKSIALRFPQPQPVTPHGNTAAYVLDAQRHSYGQAMVRTGNARAEQDEDDKPKHLGRYLRHQQLAHDAALGVWGSC